jgi:hypothetical protein
MLAAPLFVLAGDRADILFWARVLMIPLVAISLWATYVLGRELWSSRVGIWAALLTCLVPSFLFTSTEFRADDLWLALWMLTLLALMRGGSPVRRAALAGLLLGATVATSLKSILLILALGLSMLLVHASGRGRAVERRTDWRVVASFGGGVLVVPGLLIAVFGWLHALPAVFQCTILHNLTPGLGSWRDGAWHTVWFPIVLLGAIVWLRRPQGETGVEARRRVLALTPVLYLALLKSYWPLVTTQDFLPATPLLALLGVSWLVAWPQGSRWWEHGVRNAGVGLALALLVEWVLVTRAEPPWRRFVPYERELLSQVLRDTKPDEAILDLKGETVFRPRVSPLVLEGVTKARIARGLLPDRIPQDVTASRAHFTIVDDPNFPPATRWFLNRHFVSIGLLRVLGTDLGVRRSSVDTLRSFDVSYRERFAVLADGRPGGGALDGIPYRGVRWLQAGTHRYRPLPGESHVLIAWASAVERHLVPTLPGAVAR